MIRSADATVRWPGASIALTNRIWAFSRNCSDLWGSTGHQASHRGAAKHGICFASRLVPSNVNSYFQPGRVAKQRGEGMEYGYNRVGQGEHRLAFFQEGPASLPCSYNLSSFCAKSRLPDFEGFLGKTLKLGQSR